jgi:hypothetical protein
MTAARALRGAARARFNVRDTAVGESEARRWWTNGRGGLQGHRRGRLGCSVTIASHGGVLGVRRITVLSWVRPYSQRTGDRRHGGELGSGERAATRLRRAGARL